MSETAINRHAIQAMIASQATFSVSDTMIKLTTTHLPPGEIMAIRGIFGVFLLLGVIFAMREVTSLKRMAEPMVLMRAGLEGVITLLFVVSIGLMPIANYTAIIQAAPLMITALSVLAFGTAVGWRRWLAILIGFVGVLLVAKPDTGGFGFAAWLAIACALLIAIRDLVTRKIPAHVPSHIVTLSTTVASLVLGVTLTLMQERTLPTMVDYIELATAAVGVTAGNFCIIMACRKADLTVVAPFRYSVMPFALMSGYFVWGNIPDVWAALGIVLICASGLYAFHRERRRAPAALTPSPADGS